MLKDNPAVYTAMREVAIAPAIIVPTVFLMHPHPWKSCILVLSGLFFLGKPASGLSHSYQDVDSRKFPKSGCDPEGLYHKPASSANSVARRGVAAKSRHIVKRRPFSTEKHAAVALRLRRDS